jgi:hypothetical protein
MTASVVWGKKKATVDGRKWIGDMAEEIQATSDMYESMMAYSPDVDFDLAEKIAELVGGTVVEHIPVESEPGVIY